MKRTILRVIPAIALLATIFLGGPAVDPAHAHASTFPDVAETHPAHVAIESLAEKNVISGTVSGEFLPDDPVTRAQAAKIFVNWQAVPTVSSVAHLSDVPEAAVPYVGAALTRGWLNGFPDGTFRPAASLTRQQMSVILIRIVELEDEALALSEKDVDDLLEPFVDQGAVSPAARPYVAVAVMKGLLTGDKSARLSPVTPVTRAQLCLVVHRAGVLAQGDESVSETPIATEVQTPQTDSADAPLTKDERAQAAFMDAYLFAPRNSPITGEMVVQNARWYGIPVLPQLVIMAAETSLGDPKLGGTLARNYNFGCMRYHGSDTAWGLLSSGKIWVAGKDWYAFPSPQVGMAAFGRYLKTAVDGFYMPILTAADPDWDRFAGVYYGRNVSGFSSYVGRLHTLENKFRSMAAAQGVDL